MAVWRGMAQPCPKRRGQRGRSWLSKGSREFMQAGGTCALGVSSVGKQVVDPHHPSGLRFKCLRRPTLSTAPCWAGAHHPFANRSDLPGHPSPPSDPCAQRAHQCARRSGQFVEQRTVLAGDDAGVVGMAPFAGRSGQGVHAVVQLADEDGAALTAAYLKSASLIQKAHCCHPADSAEHSLEKPR